MRTAQKRIEIRQQPSSQNVFSSSEGTGISPGLHFHLAGTINALTDIPLVPRMTTSPNGGQENQHNFVLHWLNNKEMQFTQEAEKIMDDLFRIVQDKDVELELGQVIVNGAKIIDIV